MFPIPTFPKVVRVYRSSSASNFTQRRDLHTMFEGRELHVSYEWATGYRAEGYHESVERAALEKLGRTIIGSMKIIETDELPYQPEPYLAAALERAINLAERGWESRARSNPKEWDEIKKLGEWLDEYQKKSQST